MYVNLVYAMKKHKLSQKAVASKLGISQKSFTNKIYGVTDWTLGQFKQLCAIFPEEDPQKLMEFRA